jgi:YVTN family beta-propeller protein
VHAFVHVLNLAIGWAYCLDLPDPFGHGPAAGHAMALRPDGRQLLVADITGGRLAVADTETLTVTRVMPVPTGTGPAGLAATRYRTFLGLDGAVAAVDHGSGSTTPLWKAPGEIRGLDVDRDGARLAVADPDGVTWVHLDSGKPAGRVPVDGLTELLHAA